jgi:hypothetical protein
MGLTDSFAYGYITHTLFTNVKHEPGEFNFFRERREKGAKAAFHEKDEIREQATKTVKKTKKSK